MLHSLKSAFAGLAFSAALVAPSAHAIDVGTTTDLGVVTTVLEVLLDTRGVPPTQTFAQYYTFETVMPFDVEWALTPTGSQIVGSNRLWGALFAAEPGFDIADITDGTAKPLYVVGPGSEPTSLIAQSILNTVDLDTQGSASGQQILALFGLAPGSYVFAYSGTVPAGLRAGGAVGALTIVAVPEPSTWAVFALGLGLVGFAFRRQMN
jgi:hypothetical protein